MNASLETIRNAMIDLAGEKAEKFGLPRVAGQLKGLLLLHKGSMSLDEMAARLEVSKASISTNIRILERWKVVRRVYNRGERKNYYEMNGTLWEIETEIVSTIVDVELDRFRSIIERTKKSLESSKPKNHHEKEELAFVKSRFGEIEDYLEAADYFLKLLTSKGKITPALVKRIKIT